MLSVYTWQYVWHAKVTKTQVMIITSDILGLSADNPGLSELITITSR